jgi:hypothetical protein
VTSQERGTTPRRFLDLLFVGRFFERDQMRASLLQQKLGRLHARLRVEARLHHTRIEAVVERQEDHPLVMRHVRLDDRLALTRLEPFGRVIDAFVVSEVT